MYLTIVYTIIFGYMYLVLHDFVAIILASWLATVVLLLTVKISITKHLEYWAVNS